MHSYFINYLIVFIYINFVTSSSSVKFEKLKESIEIDNQPKDITSYTSCKIDSLDEYAHLKKNKKDKKLELTSQNPSFMNNQENVSTEELPSTVFLPIDNSINKDFLIDLKNTESYKWRKIYFFIRSIYLLEICLFIVCFLILGAFFFEIFKSVKILYYHFGE